MLLTVSNRNGGSFKLPGRPWKFSSGELPLPTAPALQGEHNIEVLTALGYDNAAIEGLADAGVLVGNFASQMIASVMGQVAGGTPDDVELVQPNA